MINALYLERPVTELTETESNSIASLSLSLSLSLFLFLFLFPSPFLSFFFFFVLFLFLELVIVSSWSWEIIGHVPSLSLSPSFFLAVGWWSSFQPTKPLADTLKNETCAASISCPSSSNGASGGSPRIHDL